MVPLPGNSKKMVNTRSSENSALNPDQIASQLAVIAAKLDTIVSQLRGDVAELKILMFGKPTSNQAPPPAPSTPHTLPDFSTKHHPKTGLQTLAPPPCHEQPPTSLQRPTPNRAPIPNSLIASSPPLPKPNVVRNRNIASMHLATNSSSSLLTFKPNQSIKYVLVWYFLLKPTTQQKASLKTMCPRKVIKLVHTYPSYGLYAVHSLLTGFGGSTRKIQNEGVAGWREWRPPWRIVEIAIHAMVRLEWRSRWDHPLKEATPKSYGLLAHQLPSFRLEDKSTFRAGSIDTNLLI
ncbi:hypothetical protein Hanom_Chr11g01053331 [Helianthus anomalus]